MTSKRFFLIISILVLIVLLISCSSDNKKENGLMIFCGNSFIPPTEKIIEEVKKELGITAIYTTGGSEDLLPHVKVKKQGDIFITHDPYLDYTKDAGAYSDHVKVGYVAPVIAVQKGNPKSIKRIEDLAAMPLKIALSDPKYSTCGEMVFQLLEKKAIKQGVMKNVENRLTKGHSNLGNLIKTKSVDAVIMWNGVANTFKDHLEVVKTPYEYDIEISVSVIGLNYSSKPDEVRKFMDFIRKNGEKIFTECGYTK